MLRERMDMTEKLIVDAPVAKRLARTMPATGRRPRAAAPSQQTEEASELPLLYQFTLLLPPFLFCPLLLSFLYFYCYLAVTI